MQAGGEQSIHFPCSQWLTASKNIVTLVAGDAPQALVVYEVGMLLMYKADQAIAEL